MNTLNSIFSTERPKLAIIDTSRGIKLTYRDLYEQTLLFRQQLALKGGFKEGDCVSLVAINSVEFVVSFLGTTLFRGTSAPLNPNFTSAEFEFYLSDSQSTIVLVQDSLLKKDSPILEVAKKLGVQLMTVGWNKEGIVLTAHPSSRSINPNQVDVTRVRAEPQDTCLLLHTSGTTGKPKAVPLSHQNLSRTMYNIVQTYLLTPKDTTYVVMPLFHVHGLIGALLSTLVSGGTAVIPPKFSASSFWREYIEGECNWYSAVPTIHQVLLKVPPPPKGTNIRFIRSCSSSLAPATFKQLEDMFKCPVLEAYAMTEAAHQMASNPLPPAARKPGSVGIPQGVEVRILDDEGNQVDEGEVCIKGINVTKGYLNNPQANSSSYTKDGFFRTGDQGKLDGEGYLFLTGRIKELINRGGEKISPLEVDSALLSHPNVAEAVAFAVPDSHYGQEVHAVIRLHNDTKLTESALRDHCKTKLAEFKIPKKIYFTDSLPKTATGKIQRRKMVDHFFKPPQPKL